MQDMKQITDILFTKQERYCGSAVKRGVYALFVIEPTALNIKIGADGLIYIGKTESQKGNRDHFDSKYTGRSSPRRSLGAILKEQLSLKAIPRHQSRRPQDISHYCFSDLGEEKLTEWMRKNLLYSCCEIGENIEKIEKALIVKHEPPLNLDKWKPIEIEDKEQRKRIKELRKSCRDEARKLLVI